MLLTTANEGDVSGGGVGGGSMSGGGLGGGGVGGGGLIVRWPRVPASRRAPSLVTPESGVVLSPREEVPLQGAVNAADGETLDGGTLDGAALRGVWRCTSASCAAIFEDADVDIRCNAPADGSHWMVLEERWALDGPLGPLPVGEAVGEVAGEVGGEVHAPPTQVPSAHETRHEPLHGCAQAMQAMQATQAIQAMQAMQAEPDTSTLPWPLKMPVGGSLFAWEASLEEAVHNLLRM